MSYDYNDIYNIVERLAILEGRITPTNVKHGLNKQQKSVPQLPALFKPGKGGPILGGNPNKPAVTKGYFVGAESEEKEEEALEEALANVAIRVCKPEASVPVASTNTLKRSEST